MEKSQDLLKRDLKQKVLSMGGVVEKAIDEATECLREGQSSKVAEVLSLEERINALHVILDDSCVKLLAREHPFAGDLRFIVAVVKINSDLERMGDQAVNIAHNAQRCVAGVPLQYTIMAELPSMVDDVKTIVKKSLDCFVEQSVAMAQEVLALDDRIDGWKNQIFRNIISYMKDHPDCIEQGLNFILIARNLEKIGDHATNIAEDVIFAASGRDIRHHGIAEKQLSDMNKNSEG